MQDTTLSNIINDLGIKDVGSDMPDISGILSLVDNPDNNYLNSASGNQPEILVSISKADS